MKAAYISEHGGVDTPLYSDLPDPIPRRNEVLVRVKACGVNHLDVWVRKGLPHFGPRRFPHIPGSDIAGEVAAAGPYAPPAMLESQVVLYPGVSCGYCARCLAGRDDLCSRYQIMGVDLPGGYAELVKIPRRQPDPFACRDAMGACGVYPWSVRHGMVDAIGKGKAPAGGMGVNPRCGQWRGECCHPTGSAHRGEYHRHGEQR
jgi:NADPH:quinone reductase-like Zn-dependent oxidoreductase